MIMLFHQLRTVIKEMYIWGGIGTCTHFDNPSSDIPHYAWTLIQPDGDIINKISGVIFIRPDDLRRHLDNVKRKIAPIRRLRIVLKCISSSSILMPFPTLYFGWTAKDDVYRMISIFACGSVMSIFCLLIRLIAGFILRWYVKRKLAAIAKQQY
jgi:hypothetical protein